jgi:hypothetical protein
VPRRPSIPAGASGLIVALEAHRRGDPYPLILWHGAPRECLRGALATYCTDIEVADATTACIVASAFRACRSRRHISAELPWISGVAAHHLADLTRARTRAVALAIRYASGMSAGFTEDPDRDAAGRAERAHLRVVVAIALLPAPYAQAMTLRHVQGLPGPVVARWLMDWNSIGPHGARYILREARAMLEAALMGRHPRKSWPRRYPGNPRWRTTPPSVGRRL